MPRKKQPPDDMALEQFHDEPDDQGLSLDELSESFARLLGEGEVPYDAVDVDSDPRPVGDGEDLDDAPPPGAEPVVEFSPLAPSAESLDGRAADDCHVSPENIIEAILFVGHPQGEPISSRQIASLMRGVRAAEVESLIDQLNEGYVEHNCPYLIESASTGFRMGLRPEFHAIRERFYGRIREAQLTQSAINTLAIVAYNQPLEKRQVVEIAGDEHVGRVLSQLVRRGLISAARRSVQAEESAEGSSKRKMKAPMLYQTTARFLDLFGLSSLADLPQNHDLGDG